MKDKLLLLHGALGSKKQFLELKSTLEKTYDVYDLNFEGHGGVQSANEFSIDLFTKNVIEFLRRKKIQQINIFGFSLGGYVGLSAALRIPDIIKKVITLGTKFEWSVESSEKEVKMLDPNIIEIKVAQFAKKLKEEHHPNDWKELMLKTGRMMINMGKGSKLKDEDLKSINQPVIIGIGSLDNMVSFEESEYAHKLIPNSKIIRLDGVNHSIVKNDIQNLVTFITSN
jgi:esterase/lipase